MKFNFKMILIGFLVTTLVSMIFRGYGDYCYKRGAEAGVNQGYRLRLAEEALQRFKETDSLRRLSQDPPLPSAL